MVIVLNILYVHCHLLHVVHVGIYKKCLTECSEHGDYLLILPPLSFLHWESTEEIQHDLVIDKDLTNTLKVGYTSISFYFAMKMKYDCPLQFFQCNLLWVHIMSSWNENYRLKWLWDLLIIFLAALNRIKKF